MDTFSPGLIRTVSGVVGVVVVGFLLWHDGSLAALLRGGTAAPPQTAARACDFARKIAGLKPDGSANGKFTKFLRIETDCDRKTLSFVFAISGDSRSLSEANWQMLATTLSQPSCTSQNLRRLAAYGWTMNGSYSFSDQVTRNLLASSCS